MTIIDNKCIDTFHFKTGKFDFTVRPILGLRYPIFALGNTGKIGKSPVFPFLGWDPGV